ncbi:methylated-DNA--[protein]-cysteine S-methyltransferase [Mesorhizobium xinjiangense]|uniref:methylated-DNA--[protein]-cysteine S-methyltransferase n=1 Tax=Mesorhizobium xinjiangense TaxID=2678685 RepID=UPI001F289089|nr:methylated-DNA--[protein]-cysteine S-methyltransferase [Mesorhizobium xinjiangense]
MTVLAGQYVVETAIGPIGIAWTGRGLCRVCLPEGDRAATERRLARLAPADCMTVTNVAALPRWVARLADDIGRYAQGSTVDFSYVPLDLAGIPPFRLAIYRAAFQLGFGETVTYGELAAWAGHEGEARQTGQALGANPLPLVVPCHRILAAGRKIGGFSAPGGTATKQAMLALEGIDLTPPPPAQASFAF